MIRIEMDRVALDRLQGRLATLTPHMIAKVRRALGPLMYKALEWNLNHYFIGCGPPHGPTDPRYLTSRTGNLFRSVLKSLRVLAHETNLKVTIGSNLPYAAIHEYGGYAGQCGAYIHRRPYLHPTMKDLEFMVPVLLEQAIQQVNGTL